MRIKLLAIILSVGTVIFAAQYVLFGGSNDTIGGAAKPVTPQDLGFSSYEALLSAKSRDPQAWQDVAVMLRLQGQYQKAAQAYAQAANHAASLSEQARLYETAGLLQIEASQGIIDREAYKMFTKALESNPLTVDAQFYLGVSNQSARQDEIALIHFRKFIEVAKAQHPLIPDAKARIKALTQRRSAVDGQSQPQSIIDDFNALPDAQKTEFIQTLAMQKLKQLEARGGTAQEWNDLAEMFMQAGRPQAADHARQKGVDRLDKPKEGQLPPEENKAE